MNPTYSTSTPTTFTPTESPKPGTPSPNPNVTPATSNRGRPKSSSTGSGAKRGRKPRGASTVGTGSPRIVSQDIASTNSPVFASPQFSHVHWAPPTTAGTVEGSGVRNTPGENESVLQGGITSSPGPSSVPMQIQPAQSHIQQPQPSVLVPGPSNTNMNLSMPSSTSSSIPVLDTTGLISLAGVIAPVGAGPPPPSARPQGADEDGEGEDEWLPAMADDDYSAQLSWQSQSKDNLKCVFVGFGSL
jgi:transcription initiation factor TFIID subunit 11